MTPYARCSARLSRQRDAENAAWVARGDPRVMGDAARARMQELLHDAVLAKPASELLAEMLERLRKAINKVRYG